MKKILVGLVAFAVLAMGSVGFAEVSKEVGKETRSGQSSPHQKSKKHKKPKKKKQKKNKSHKEEKKNDHKAPEPK